MTREIRISKIQCKCLTTYSNFHIRGPNAKKENSKKSIAKKLTKKSSKKENVHVVMMSDFLDGDTAIHMVGDTDDFPGPMNRMSMEKIMGQLTRKLQTLNLTEEELQQVDLASLLNSMPTPQTNDPREQAQELVYSAFESHDPKQQVAIAKKALKLDPDSVDALVILAEHASRHVFDAIDGYRKAVQAGERNLGEEFFKQNAGHFWAIHETRPYMRAMEQLADVLRSVVMDQQGHKAFDQINLEALEIYQKMLRLNPGDNQGVRYKLLYFLLELDRDDEAEKLYNEYRDDFSAWWKYGRALLDFRKQGDTAKSRKSLAAAVTYNKHFPQYLLGRKRFPPAPPGHYGVGDANEAAYYMNSSFHVWQKTPGAVDWVEEYIDR